jgi:uncharacterized protein YndB with AHSA1/START domain
MDTELTASEAEVATTTKIFRTWIMATPEAIWEALTDPRQIARYGYGGDVDFDLKPGGIYRAKASKEMAEAGTPAVMVEGEVLEVNEPVRLVQTWHALFGPETTAEPVSQLTYEITPGFGGVTELTVIHELEGAPVTTGLVSGDVAEAGGGWTWILSDLKTLLETGSSLPMQMPADSSNN